jgi:hypothetical protein
MSLNRTVLILALIASPCLAQPITGEEVIEPSPKQLAQLRALTPESVEGQVSIKTDSLEPLITVTSDKVWKSNGKFTDKVRSDNFLRAFIDKRTGEVRYQLYQEVTYTGEWRRFASVHYETSSGPASAQIAPISQEVIGCSFGLCAYREAIGFDVPRQVLEEVAGRYSTRDPAFWRFRFKGQNGLDWEDRIAPAEVAGLLRAVDRQVNSLGPSQ